MSARGEKLQVASYPLSVNTRPGKDLFETVLLSD